MNPVMFNSLVDRTRFTNSYEADAFPLNRCKISLKNKDLWRKFHELETEMIITKSGRRMFPSFHIQVGDLDPNAYYCILLEMTPASHCRYKYSASGGWSPAGTEEAQSPHRIYLHPESPAKGDYWMSQPISFGRLKVTNTPNAPTGQVVLSSMHKYQPRVIIVKSNDPRNLMWAPSTSVVFPETQFIAVTAYQNEKITQLKIDNNPFAKGFRENGQAKCKRKRANPESQNEEESDTKRHRTNSENTILSKDDEDRISVCSSTKTIKDESLNSLSDTSSCASPHYSVISPRIADLKQESRSVDLFNSTSSSLSPLSSATNTSYLSRSISSPHSPLTSKIVKSRSNELTLSVPTVNSSVLSKSISSEHAAVSSRVTDLRYNELPSPLSSVNSLDVSKSTLHSPTSGGVTDLSSNELSSPVSRVNSSLDSPVYSPHQLTDANMYHSYSTEKLTYPTDRLRYAIERHNNSNCYPYPYGFNTGYYPTHYSNMFNAATVPYFYNHYYNSIGLESPKDLSVFKGEKEVKKFTDFSISTIMAK